MKVDETENDFNLKMEEIEFSEKDFRSKITDIKYNFRTTEANKMSSDFNARRNEISEISEKFRFQKPVSTFDLRKTPKDTPDESKAEGFNWRGAFSQSLVFLGVQHGYAILGQAKTRRALKGKFWNDYVDSVKSLHGWADGGRFFTNYIAHPMQGSLNGFIYVQNSPQARREQFSMKSIYWRTRMKAMLWTTAWSTQFEIGPISQASIGNVGEKGKQTWEDIVTTPTLGTAMLITEDAIDQYLIKAIERRTDNYYVMIFSRMLLNPTRIFANLLRLKLPWYRDRPREN